MPATLSYGAVLSQATRQLSEFGADSEIWDLIPWPSRKPSLEEVYWLAGVFEGEGDFTDRSTVRITQKDREILDRVRQLVGGRIKLRRREHPIHYWHASGPRARGFIRTIYPLLSERRKAQARAFLKIPRGIAEPRLDPTDHARYLWDWQPPGSEELE